MDKPFVFTASSSSNGPSTELVSHPSITTHTLPRPTHHSSFHDTNTQSSSSHRGPYYSSTMSNDFGNRSTDGIHQIMTGAYEDQPKLLNGYRYSTTTVTTTKSTHSYKPDLTLSYPSSSSSSSSSASSSSGSSSSSTTQHPSPSTPVINISPSAIAAPRLLSSPRSASSQLLTLQDGAFYSVSSYGLKRHDLPPIIDHHVNSNCVSLPPLIPTGQHTATRSVQQLVGQDDEVDSGYYDGSSAAEHRRMKRRKELNHRIDALNNNFIQHKERIFAEKLVAIQNEVGQIHNNTHSDYKEALLVLESMRQQSIHDGRQLYNYQTKVSDHQFTLEIRCAEEEYKAERQQVRERLFAALDEKRQKLVDDKNNCDLAYDVVLESQTRVNKRNCLRRRGLETERLNKRKQQSALSLVFKLKDEDVYDDLQAMRCGQVKRSHKKK